MVIVYKSIEEKVPVAEQFKCAQIDKTSSLTVLLSITVSDDVLSIRVDFHGNISFYVYEILKYMLGIDLSNRDEKT